MARLTLPQIALALFVLAMVIVSAPAMAPATASGCMVANWAVAGCTR